MRSTLVMPLALAVLASPLLSGCSLISGRSGPPAPSPVPLVCPASLAAEIPAEPLPPEGIDPSTLPPALSAFLWGEWVPWSRANTHRLGQAQKWCIGKTHPPDG
mgnify:CR=1 FL=1